MARPRRPAIADALRARIHGAMLSGALRGGDRLPSTRELAADLAADPRVIADAYRQLAGEGLVELRPRAGVFLAELPGTGAVPAAGAGWIADVIVAAVRHEVTADRLAEVVAAATRARPMRAVVVTSTLDQGVGIARELRDDLGMEARALLDDQIVPGEPLPRAVARAHLLVGTERTEARVRRLAERTGKRCVVIDVRADLLGPSWRMLLSRTPWVVVADPRFAPLVHAFVAAAASGGDAPRGRILVAGRDDLSVIPPDAPTYVTEAARERLERSRLPGRVVPSARTLSDPSLRAIAEALVAHNLEGPAAGARARRA